jgi:cytochrome c1
MNATEYLTNGGLHALIRNPKAVRTWPQQQIPAFDAKALSDADLDAVIAYLTAMAAQP